MAAFLDNPVSQSQLTAAVAAITLAGYDLGNLGATETIDLTNGQVQYGTLDANTAITLPAPGADQQLLKLILTQDETGGRLPTFLAADGTLIEWEGLGGQAPSLDLIKSGPYTNLVISFDIGQGRIIAQVDNPYLANIIAAPALVTDPREIDSSLVMWLDAADGGTLIPGVGSGIAAWLDKSGHGHGLAQGTSANQPVAGTMSDGRPAMVMSASPSHYMTGADHTDFDGTDFTVFVVFERDSDSGASQQIFAKGSSGGGTLEWALSIDSIDRFNTAAQKNNAGASASGRVWGDGTNTVDQPYIYEVQVSESGGTVTAFNRIDGGTPNSGTFAGTRYVGTGGFLLSNSTHSVAEILYYNTALDSTKRDALVSYLAAKWK